MVVASMDLSKSWVSLVATGSPSKDMSGIPRPVTGGYGGLPEDKEEWLNRYRTSIAMLKDLKDKGIAGGIYTQTTDVEGEINGLITYDREVQKVSPEQLEEIGRVLFE